MTAPAPAVLKLKRKQATLEMEINKLKDEVKKAEKRLMLHKVSFLFLLYLCSTSLTDHVLYFFLKKRYHVLYTIYFFPFLSQTDLEEKMREMQELRAQIQRSQQQMSSVVGLLVDEIIYYQS